MYHQIETQKTFSKSHLWQLQRNYFSQMGIDIWRNGEAYSQSAAQEAW